MGSLCNTLERLAGWTARTLDSAQEYDMTYGEDSVTDYLLLEMKRQNEDLVSLEKHSSSKEGDTGADWEWWITGANEGVGLRVQAKRFQPENEAFEDLDKPAGDSGPPQVEALIESAKDPENHDSSLYPLYCFYTPRSAAQEFLTSLPWPPAYASPPLWGCSIASAYFILVQVNEEGSNLAPSEIDAFPWSHLACQYPPDASSDPGIGGVFGSVSTVHERATRWFSEATEEAEADLPGFFEPEEHPPRRTPEEQYPTYVQAMTRQMRSGDREEDIRDRLPEGLRGVLLMDLGELEG